MTDDHNASKGRSNERVQDSPPRYTHVVVHVRGSLPPAFQFARGSGPLGCSSSHIAASTGPAATRLPLTITCHSTSIESPPQLTGMHQCEGARGVANLAVGARGQPVDHKGGVRAQLPRRGEPPVLRGLYDRTVRAALGLGDGDEALGHERRAVDQRQLRGQAQRSAAAAASTPAAEAFTTLVVAKSILHFFRGTAILRGLCALFML